jgi:sugar phosphate permease
VLAAVPGLVIAGVGQGIAWTAMWITAATGVASKEQGVASGMASTTLNLGNALGLAILILIANAGVHGQQGDQLRAELAQGGFIAVLLTAVGMVIGTLVITFFLPRKAKSASVDEQLTASEAQLAAPVQP